MRLAAALPLLKPFTGFTPGGLFHSANPGKLGVDASAAGGPKGRDAAAATDATMRAEILTYSRSRGLFAGVSLEGSTLRPDNDANKKLYQKELHARNIVLHQAVRAPASAKQLLSVLNTQSPRNRSQRG
jgi:lipid-binding SYLF domain-containing protein